MQVCDVVRSYAFKRTSLPLIVSLEVHCSPSQQEIVCELIHDYWGEFLHHHPDDFSDTTPLPPLESLKKRILVRCFKISFPTTRCGCEPRAATIASMWSLGYTNPKTANISQVKVKFVPPQKARKAQADDDDDDSTSAEGDVDAAKKSKIIEKLSSMGIFTRAFHFRGFDDATAHIPTHVFSLGETKLLEACEEQPEKLFSHNLHYLMRAYPKGTRLRSTNLDPTPFWRQGVQMVALNYQKMDAANMLNFAQFEATGGYVLKPDGYLPRKDGQPKALRRSLDVSIRIYAAQALGTPKDVPDAYVKCELHTESKAEFENNEIPKEGQSKGGEWKRSTRTLEARDPEYDEVLDFKAVHDIVPELSFVR